MKSSLTLLLGAIGIAGVFASAQALAQDDNHERSGSSHEHAAPQPSRGGEEHGYSAPRGPAPSHAPSYHQSPSYGGREAPSHGYPSYRGASGYDRGPGYSGGYDRGYQNYRSPPMHAAPSGGMNGHYAPPSAGRFSAHERGRPSVAFRTFSGFRGRNVASLSIRDRGMWTGGGWRHERYHGRLGWWWVVNGAWFFYDDPVYPYPTYISDYAYDDYADYGDGDYGQGEYGQGDTAWWCSWPQGYYPDVQSCSAPWQPVPTE